MTDATTLPASPATELAIERTVKLHASRTRVWRALTERAELCRWYPESMDFEMRAGASGWMHWAEHGAFAVRVEAVEPMRYLAWRWAREPETALRTAQSTLVEWWLDERPDGDTTLRLRESGFVDAAHRAENEEGWTGGLATLRAILEEPMNEVGAGVEIPAIEREVTFAASPERVWRAISDPTELARWFPQRAEWDLRPGGTGTFYWEGHGSFPIEVEAVEPPRYLAWTWGREADSDPATEESATLVEWWVEPRDGGGATLRMRESGFRFPSHRSGNDQGWTEELGELVALLEEDS